MTLGAFLAPLLYWGAQWIAGYGILEWLVEQPFRKFFHRALLVAALVLLWPTARWLRISGIRELGLEPNSRRWNDALIGFAIAFLTTALLGGVLIALPVAEFRMEILWWKLAQVVVSAVVVAFLEEWLFRGAILGLMLRSMRPLTALFWSAALFSILHFLKPDTANPETVGWFSGFALIPGAFGQFREPWLVLGGWVTLFCVGWILGWTRLRTRGLGMAIGLHAGWILGSMGFNKIARRSLPADVTLPWVGDSLIVGLVSVAIVLFAGLLVWLTLRKRSVF